MARYRKYDVRISLDERVRRLTPMEASGEALWYYLLSMPESSMIPGLSRVGRAAIAEARKWSLEGFDKAFGELFREGLAKADWEARVVWIPNVIRYDPPSNPNVVLGWATHWDEIPDCPIKAEAWKRFHAFFSEMAEAKRQETKREGDPEAFLKAFLKACPNPSVKGSRNPSPNPRAPARIRIQEPDTDTGVKEGENAYARPSETAPEKNRPPKFDPRSVPIPATLDTPEFREKWELRLKERAEPGRRGSPPSESSVTAQLGKLEQLAKARGLPAAIACVERATDGRHQGIVFPEDFEVPRNGGWPTDDGRRSAGGHEVLPPSRSIRMVDRIAAYEAEKAKESAT